MCGMISDNYSHLKRNYTDSLSAFKPNTWYILSRYWLARENIKRRYIYIYIFICIVFLKIELIQIWIYVNVWNLLLMHLNNWILLFHAERLYGLHLSSGSLHPLEQSSFIFPIIHNNAIKRKCMYFLKRSWIK